MGLQIIFIVFPKFWVCISKVSALILTFKYRPDTFRICSESIHAFSLCQHLYLKCFLLWLLISRLVESFHSLCPLCDRSASSMFHCELRWDESQVWSIWGFSVLQPQWKQIFLSCQNQPEKTENIEAPQFSWNYRS